MKRARAKGAYKDRRATELHRSLRAVARLEGWVTADPESLWLLPADPAAAGGRGTRPAPERLASEELAAAFLAPALPETMELSRLLGADHPVALEDQRLARWSRHLTRLDRADDLETLLADGVRKLRGYRHRPLGEEMRRKWSRLERFRGLVSAWRAWNDPEQRRSLSPERVGEVLRARLELLADWPEDPVPELIRQPTLPASAALAAVARSEALPAVRALATVILARRHREGASLEPSLRKSLPRELELLFARVGRRGAPWPVLETHAFLCDAEAVDLRSVPDRHRAQLVSCCERVAALCGSEVAVEALAHLSSTYLAPAERDRARERHCRRFGELLEGGAVNSSERALCKELLRVRQSRHPRIRYRRLVRLFVDWCQELEAETWSSRGSLLASIRSGMSLRRAADKVARAWCQAARQAESAAADPDQGLQRARLRASWTVPEARLRLDRLPRSSEQLLDLLGRLGARQTADTEDTRRRAELLLEIFRAPKLNLEAAGRWLDRPVPLVRKALEAGVMVAVDQLGDPGLGRYLDCVRRFEAADLEAPFATERWFIRLFDEKKSWQPALELATVATGRAGQADPIRLMSLSHALAGRPSRLTAALSTWVEVEVRSLPPEWPALVELGLYPETLRKFLHHRRLAGEGERFSNAILAPLLEQQRLEGQISFLAAKLAREPEQGTLEALEAAKRRLGSPNRLRRTLRKAARSLDRSLAVMRKKSLDRVLDEACRASASKMLGRRLPEKLPAGFRDAFHLLAQEDTDLELVKSLLLDVLAGRRPEQRPANRRWLQQAGQAGVDVDLWVAGPSFCVDIGDQTVCFKAEHDPLHVLRMGSYFDTCLDIEEGFNAGSTLTNAVDINKRVLYGRADDGTVVARKLIGCTADGRLAGYRTYGRLAERSLRPAVSAALLGFAEFCGIRPDDQATPENLHGSFWYDDGNESWLRSSQIEPAPPEVPGDQAAQLEWNLERAVAAGDHDRVVSITGFETTEETTVLAWFRLLQSLPGRPARSPAVAGWKVSEQALELALCEPGIDPPRLDLGAETDGHGQLTGVFLSALGAPPGRDETLARQALQLSPRMPHLRCPLRFAVARLPPSLACSVLALVARREAETGLGKGRPSRFLRVLATSYLTAADRRAWGREVARHEALQSPLLTLADRIPMPELASLWRHTCATADAWLRERAALALSRLGGGRETADFLLEILRRQPGSLAVAAAVIRCGDQEAATEARELWSPTLDALSVLQATSSHGLLRQVLSRRFLRRLRRQLARLAESGEPMGDLLRAVALFADPRLEPLQLCRSVDASLAESRAAMRAQGLWRERIDGDREDSGDEVSELVRLSERGPCPETFDKIARRDDPELSMAALTLLGEAVGELGEQQRWQAARQILGSADAAGSVETLSTSWVLTADLPESQRADAFLGVEDSRDYHADNSGRCWLLLRLAECGDDVLDAWFEVCLQTFDSRPERSLRWLDRTLRWIGAERVEARVRALLRQVPADPCAAPWYQLLDEASYHLDQLLVEEVGPRLGDQARQKLIDDIKGWNSRRGAWTLRRLGADRR